jgi:hypothetical protein
LLFLGDCLHFQGKADRALEQYRKVMKSNGKLVNLAAVRAAGVLIEREEHASAK